MKVIWSYVAVGNLIESNRFIAKENPEAARSVINEIYETGNRIKEYPGKGRIVPELNKKNIREIFFRNYRIIYRVESKRIIILTVRHMRQELNRNDI